MKFKKMTACVLLAALLLSTLVMSSAAAGTNGTASDYFGFGSYSLLGRLMEEYNDVLQQQEAEETQASMALSALNIGPDGYITSVIDHQSDATATANYGSGSASYAIDGDTESRWNPNTGNVSTLTLTWNKAISFDKISASLSNASRISKIDVYYSEDGVNYTKINSVKSGSTLTVNPSEPVTNVKSIRFVVTPTSNRSHGIYEINVLQTVRSIMKNFPVTLYNYSDSRNPIDGKADINEEMREIERALNGGNDPAVWNGFYFSTGNPKTNYGGEYGAWNYYVGTLGWSDPDVYTGIVADKLVNGIPVFVHGDAGIFDDSNTTAKNVYTNVQIPFLYSEETGRCTYDSGIYSVYFANKNYQSGATLEYSNPFQVGGHGEFFPFNIEGDNKPVYHFGMQASVAFHMNKNARLLADDDTSDPVTFTFSGDDDVWVFLDDTLALDLGGIHGKATGTIDFLSNTVTVNGEVVAQLFDTVDQLGRVTVGILGATIEQYSLEQHNLKIFYLERGENSSNCQISFNLPLNDRIDVTKKVNTDAFVNLTDEQLDTINNAEYKFKLFDENDVVLANAEYALFTGAKFERFLTTDANGVFTLRNNQTARFFAMLDKKYYVKEIITGDTKFDSVTWEATWNGTATGSETYSTIVNGGEYDSMLTKNISREDSYDYAAFVCTNTLDPYFLSINGETFVLDYGLPVILDVLKNDIQYGRQLLISSASILSNGSAVIVNKTPEGTYVPVSEAELANMDATDYRYILYTPESEMASVDTITYTLVTSEYDFNNGSYTHSNDSTADAKVVPATTVYYEDNFPGIIYNGDNWTPVVTESDIIYQESGLVAKLGDPRLYSTYGTDIAYAESACNDSNGSSMMVTSYAHTEGKTAPSFSYTFNGTGTAIYMRTDVNSGMIRVRVYDSEGAEVTSQFISARQLYYAADAAENPATGETIYNVPVVNITGLDYGTYTIKVTCLNYIAGTMENASGAPLNTFYVDGFRVYDPLGAATDTAAINAYLADTEDKAIYTELRDKLLTDMTRTDEVSGSLVFDPDSFALFTDSDGNVTDPTDYMKIGPKNEVYLTTGQSVQFNLSKWYENNKNYYNVYIGVKTPNGVDGTIEIGHYEGTAFVADRTINVKSTVESYVKITDLIEQEGYVGKIVIRAASGDVISLTNIKVTGRDYDVIEND